jgi:hypothetical protein
MNYHSYTVQLLSLHNSTVSRGGNGGHPTTVLRMQSPSDISVAVATQLTFCYNRVYFLGNGLRRFHRNVSSGFQHVTVYIGCGFYNVVLWHISYFAFVNSGSRTVSMEPYNVSLTITGGLFWYAAWCPLAITTIQANNIRNKFFFRKFLIIFAAHIIMAVSRLQFWIVVYFAPAANSVTPIA